MEYVTGTDAKMTANTGAKGRMEDRVFRTRELEATGLATGYSIWFRLPDDSRVTIEMSLAGLLRLKGLVCRSVDTLTEMMPDEMNAYAGAVKSKGATD